MESNAAEGIDDRRFVEVDSILKPLNVALAVVVVGVALAFSNRFSPWFLVFALVPASWWIARLGFGIDARLGLRQWNRWLLLAVLIGVVGASSTSGGTNSPVVFFASIVGFHAQAVFPNVKLGKAGGLLAVALIVAIDIAAGRPIDLYVLIIATLGASYFPLIGGLLVEVERVQRRSAVLDVLTGCLNRRSFEERSAELGAQSQLTGEVVSIISFDIDHFKNVNDSWGHAAGDEVLENVAYVARKQLRRFELMFRLGGEEFTVVLPGTPAAIAAEIAEQLRSAIEEATTGDIRVTASFGVATGIGDVDAVLATADERLYAAKASGRNQVIGSQTDEPITRR